MTEEEILNSLLNLKEKSRRDYAKVIDKLKEVTAETESAHAYYVANNIVDELYGDKCKLLYRDLFLLKQRVEHEIENSDHRKRGYLLEIQGLLELMYDTNYMTLFTNEWLNKSTSNVTLNTKLLDCVNEQINIFDKLLNDGEKQ